MSIFHSQGLSSSDPRRECENRYIVWLKQLFFILGPSPTEKFALCEFMCYNKTADEVAK